MLKLIDTLLLASAILPICAKAQSISSPISSRNDIVSNGNMPITTNANTRFEVASYQQVRVREEMQANADRNLSTLNEIREPAFNSNINIRETSNASMLQSMEMTPARNIRYEITGPQPSNIRETAGLPANNYVNPGRGTVTPLYNLNTGRYYYYCTSDETKRKAEYHCFNPYASYGNVYQEGELAMMCGITQTWLLMGIIMNHALMGHLMLAPDNTTAHSNSSRFLSFDGFMVYGADTVSGVVTITQNNVSVEKQSGNGRRRSYNASLHDTALKAIVVFKGIKTLSLVRLSPADKYLHRVVHHGKLAIYDRSYSFVTADNLAKQVIAEYEGKRMNIKTTDEMRSIMNVAYGAGTAHPTTTRSDLMRILITRN